MKLASIFHVTENLLYIVTHTEKSFRNLVNSNQIRIVITLFREKSTAIGIPIDVLNLLENDNYNPNLVWINKIPKKFLPVRKNINKSNT